MSAYIRLNDVLLIHKDNALRYPRLIQRVKKLIKSKSDIEIIGASVKVHKTCQMVQRSTNK